MTGAELRRTREALGYERRQDFAEALGVTRGALEHWEYGRRPIPQYVFRILDCLTREAAREATREAHRRARRGVQL